MPACVWRPREASKIASEKWAPSMGQPSKTWFRALVRQRCPLCRHGPIFRGGITMNETCPVCGVKFEREQGYFLGAMYFSFGLSSILLVTLFILGSWLLPDWESIPIGGLAFGVFLLFVPIIFRYSRVLWIYFDRWAWPRD